MRLPLSSWSAALIAALIGFGGTVALVVQATQALGASEAQTLSSVTALCVGIAVVGAIFSAWLRMPIILAWSTPGAALLASTAPGISWPMAVGVFGAAGALMVVTSLVPLFGRLAGAIPTFIASAMLGGVLLPFCLALFRAAEVDPLPVLLLLTLFLIARQRIPRYAMVLALIAGVAIILIRGDAAGETSKAITLGHMIFTMPMPDLRLIASLAVPLFLVTLVSQNLPGLVVLESAGYRPAPRPLLFGTGLATMALAPFGAHGINLAAITAAICTDSDAHPEARERWKVGLAYALFYTLLAAASPLLVGLFLSMPHSMIAILTGLALLAPLGGAVETMLAGPGDRDIALLTFVATASGLSLFGIGSAFWGLLTGFAALGIRRLFQR